MYNVHVMYLCTFKYNIDSMYSLYLEREVIYVMTSLHVHGCNVQPSTNLLVQWCVYRNA